MYLTKETSITKRFFTLIFTYEAVIGLIFGICLMTFIAHGASTITINPSTQYQTIDGFGAMTDDGLAGPPVFMHDSLGLTLSRLWIPDGLQSANNMTDSTNSDITKFKASSMGSAIAAVNSIKSYGDVKFFATSLSPPAWMKDMTRDSLKDLACYDLPVQLCGGHLATKYYQAFAGLISAFCKIMKTQTGVDIFAVSLQNEPYFIEPYNSCVYTPQEYANTLKVLGARLKKDGIPAACIGAEDLVDAMTERSYVQTIAADTAASKYIYAVAVHAYALDGIHPIPTSEGGKYWSDLGNIGVVAAKKKTWMTEASGWGQNVWTDAMNLAANLFMSLKYGRISAWVYYRAMECSTMGLVCNGTHTRISLVSRNYYKFIRPGAMGIGCVCTGDTLWPVAFVHPVNKTMSIVVLNQAATARTLTLSSAAALPATFEKYTTTSVKKCVDEGSVSSSSAITIDASSVTTLFATNYSVNIADNGKIGRSVAVHVVKKENRYFRIDGSSVEGSSPLYRGVYIKAVQDKGNLRISPVAVIK
jgi:glucuronoarabinoxylan endo-1,4-beta-xylanase